MITLANKGRMSAAGFAPGGGIPGKVGSRKLGNPGEGKPYMSAMTKSAGQGYCALHHQATCSGGYPSVSSNKGQGWKPNQKSGTVPKNVFPAFVQPSNYKRRQDNHR